MPTRDTRREMIELESQARQLFAVSRTPEQVANLLNIPLTIARMWQSQSQEPYVALCKRIYLKIVGEGWIPPPIEAESSPFRDEMCKRLNAIQR